ncbi:MAG: hypothetical protein JKY25_13730 [Robiginitomaculum sp.]|nr:hypothetical protein [Robiginitomaculum sp.]
MNIAKNTRVLSVALLGFWLLVALAFSGRFAFGGTLDRPFFRSNAIVIVFGGSDFLENGGVSLVATDFYLLDNIASGQAAPDIIGVDGVTVEFFGGANTPTSDGTARTNELLRIEGQTSGGVLTNVADFNVLDANDSLTAFGVDNNTDLDMASSFRVSQFYVTANTAFDVFAHASNLTTTNDFTSLGYADIGYFLFSQTTGSAAQNPAIGGQGRMTAINDLGDMSSGPTKVFDGGRRTARVPGTILQQAFSFIPIYFISNGDPGNTYDLSAGIGTIGATVTYTIYTP